LKSTKEKRDFLLKDKPYIRKAILLDQDGFTEDMGILWVSYQRGGFTFLPRGFDKSLFIDVISSNVQNYQELLLIEDNSKVFQSGRGPIGVIGINNDGWKIEPHVDYFPWATSRMILRASVAYFQMVKYDKEVGVCVVKSLGNTARLFHRLKDYGVLWFVGKIPYGDVRGDEYLFTVKGRKNARNNGDQHTDQLQRTSETA